METIRKGWECPKCGRIYSPYTTMCLYCNSDNVKINEPISIPMEELNLKILNDITDKFPNSVDCCTGPHIDSTNAADRHHGQ